VNAGIEYHVFLTPSQDCKGLYVNQKSAASFEVHELGGGTSSIAFDCRIMAKRVGNENVRLTDVTKQFNNQQAHRRMMRRPVQPMVAPRSSVLLTAPQVQSGSYRAPVLAIHK
jgi:hypothetical protein